jgi:hypothetical protein
MCRVSTSYRPLLALPQNLPKDSPQLAQVWPLASHRISLATHRRAVVAYAEIFHSFRYYVQVHARKSTMTQHTTRSNGTSSFQCARATFPPRRNRDWVGGPFPYGRAARWHGATSHRPRRVHGEPENSSSLDAVNTRISSSLKNRPSKFINFLNLMFATGFGTVPQSPPAVGFQWPAPRGVCAH